MVGYLDYLFFNTKKGKREMNQNTFCKYCHRIPSQCGCTYPVKELTAQEVMEQTHKKISEAHWKVKELTDEEITELANEYLCYISHEYEVTGIYKFAKAILRKVQGDV